MTKSRSWSRMSISASANCLSLDVLGQGTCFALNLQKLLLKYSLLYGTHPSQTRLMISCNLLPLKKMMNTDFRTRFPWIIQHLEIDTSWKPCPDPQNRFLFQRFWQRPFFGRPAKGHAQRNDAFVCQLCPQWTMAFLDVPTEGSMECPLAMCNCKLFWTSLELTKSLISCWSLSNSVFAVFSMC